MKQLRVQIGKDGYFRKIHQSGFSMKGIPDILGCYKGRMIGLEDKVVRSVRRKYVFRMDIFTPDQIANLKGIYEAGGVALGVVLIDSGVLRKKIFLLEYLELMEYSEVGFSKLENQKCCEICHNKWDLESLFSKINQ